MKKTFLYFVLLLTIFINNSIKADELILSVKDGVEVKSDSFIQVDNKINLVKGSNLYIDITGGLKDDYENIEPKLNIEILNKQNKIVWSASSPKTKAPDTQTDAFEKYLDLNKNFFTTVSYINNKINIKIPLNIEGGEYKVVINSSNYKNISVEHPFIVSNSPYNFTNSNIMIEDANVLANIGYTSTLNTDETYKVVVTLSQDQKELFKKEINKVMYTEGVISINEKIDLLKDLTGKAQLKVEIIDKDGSVLLSTVKDVDVLKSSNKYIYYMILTILILLLIIIFMLLKKRKEKILAVVMLLLMTSITLIGFRTALALTDIEVCGPKPNPDSVCDASTEWMWKKYACKRSLSDSCTQNDVRARKYFSSGKVLNITSGTKNADGANNAAKASVNVCNQIAKTFVSGDNFYVISSSEGSSWENKRFHIFKFTKGVSVASTTSAGTFDELGSGKRNVNKADYNGGCIVNVYSYFDGPDSNSEYGATRVVEVGYLTPSVCKSRVVNGDVFESKGDLLNRQNCLADEDLRNTYIAGSVYFPPITNIDGTNRSSWHDKSVDICSLLGYTSSNKPVGENFYALMKQESSWWMIKYPIFKFKFGTAENKIYREAYDIKKAQGLSDDDFRTWARKNLYYYGTKKENVPGMKYDGNCNITFRLDNRGEDTDSWTNGYDLIEVGMVQDATCYDPTITRDSTYNSTTGVTVTNAYRYDTKSARPGQIQYQTKVDSDGWPDENNPPIDGGKYSFIAPFLNSLPFCQSATVCSIDRSTGTWIPYYDGSTCTPTIPVSVCEGSDYVTRQNGVETGRVVNDLAHCSLSSTCIAKSDSSNTIFTVTAKNAVGNIKYTNNGVSTTLAKTTSYVYTVPKTNTVQSISVTLQDLTTNQTANASCSIDNTPPVCDPQVDPTCNPGNPPTTQPPTINLTKQPKVSLNKNGACTINWDIANMPSGTTCSLSGWKAGGVVGNDLKNIDLDPASGSGNGNVRVEGLESNQKYVLTCSGGSLVTPLTNSVICRVNSTIKEK